MEIANLTAATTANTSASSLSQLGEDYNRFLTLLTAQISNQDPLEPMDSTQFVAQLAQLSQVEQSVKTNSQLESLGAQISALTAVAGTNMIGRNVTLSSNLVQQEAGSNQTFYRLPVAAQTVSAELVDTLGRVVHRMENLSGTAEKNINLAWDGRDDQGQMMLDGIYKLSMKAQDSQGNQVPVYTYRKADVQEVLFSQGALYYDVSGNETVSSEAVLAIR